MNRRYEVLSSLFLLVLAIIIVVGGAMWWRVGKELEDIRAEDRRMVIGTDDKLKSAVTNLELDLRERVEYQFDTKVDPLDLTRVITSRAILKKLGMSEFERTKKKMRLCATVVGADGVAAIVIRYMGSNHVLREGDKLADWVVLEIGQRSAILKRGGATRKLVNERAPEAASDEGLMMSVAAP